MANSITIAEAKKLLGELPEKLSRRKRATAVTRDGKRVLAVMSWERYRAMEETLEILSDPEVMASIRRSEEDFKAGRTHSVEEVRRSLGL